METNDACQPVKSTTKTLIGIAFAVAGVALLLFNLNIIDDYYRPMVFSWQALLILAGFLNLFSRNNWPTGLLLISVGALFMVNMVLGLDIDVFKFLLPIGLIFVGLIIITKRSKPFNEKMKMKFEAKMGKCYHQPETGERAPINDVNIFGGSKRIYTDIPFEGGNIANIFGGTELDLRQTELKDGTTVLDCVNIFGGMVLIVPEHWEIKAETVAIIGGFADKRKNISFCNGNKRLIIKGVNIFGGTEVKNDEWTK